MFDQRISTPVYQSIQTGDAIGHILDEVGWPGTMRSLDVGANSMAFWWAEDVTVWNAIKSLLVSEGPYARVFISSSGCFVFHDRNHRYTSTSQTDSQVTFSNAAEPKYTLPLEYDIGWRNIVNDVTVDVQSRYKAEGAQQVVWEYPDRIWVDTLENVKLKAVGTNPFVNALTPVEDTDYELVKGSVLVTLDRNSGGAVTVSLANLSATTRAVVENLQLRARPLLRNPATQINVQSTNSQDDYGIRSYRLRPEWTNETNARDLGQLVLERYKQPQAQVKIRVHNATTERIDEQLTRELDERVTVVNTANGMSTDFIIDHIRHNVGQAGKNHDTVYTMTKIPTYTVGTTEAFILDSTDQGRLDQDKLAF